MKDTFLILIRSGPGVGNSVRLHPDQTCCVGREPACDLTIACASVLPRHMLLDYRDGELSLRKAAADSAVSVNGNPVTGDDPVYLVRDDVVGIGDCELMVVLDPDSGLASSQGISAAAASWRDHYANDEQAGGPRPPGSSPAGTRVRGETAARGAAPASEAGPTRVRGTSERRQPASPVGAPESSAVPDGTSVRPPTPKLPTVTGIVPPPDRGEVDGIPDDVTGIVTPPRHIDPGAVDVTKQVLPPERPHPISPEAEPPQQAPGKHRLYGAALLVGLVGTLVLLMTRQLSDSGDGAEASASGDAVIQRDDFQLTVPSSWQAEAKEAVALFVPRQAGTTRAGKGAAVLHSGSGADCRWDTYRTAWDTLAPQLAAVPELERMEWQFVPEEVYTPGVARVPAVAVFRSELNAVPYAVLVGQAPELRAKGRLFLAGNRASALLVWSPPRSPAKMRESILDSFVPERMMADGICRAGRAQVGEGAAPVTPDRTKSLLDEAESIYAQRKIARTNAWRAYDLLVRLHGMLASLQGGADSAIGPASPAWRSVMEREWELLTRAASYIQDEFRQLTFDLSRARRMRNKKRIEQLKGEIELLIPDDTDWRRVWLKRELAPRGKKR